jgi:hypothetical protein
MYNLGDGCEERAQGGWCARRSARRVTRAARRHCALRRALQRPRTRSVLLRACGEVR